MRSLYAIIVKQKNMYWRTCGSLKSANHKKDWLRKSQIREVSHERMARKFNKLFKSAIRGFAICELI
jgi:hypothetical protein